ncbi:MAG TPA: hypothetical protein VE988_02660 [Gemmataceae bacterium]|nr:hypothetical protein [Gemmataceae bacterium]
MINEKLTRALVDALKVVLTQPGEHRLFKSGKLPGVFEGRAGLNADAAAQAMRDGLLEVARTETKGKTTTEWVRVTPKGIEFVHRHESPVQALHDLRTVLQMTQDGIPKWMGELRKDLQTLGDRLTDQALKIAQHVDALSQRVTEALERAEAVGSKNHIDVASIVPWGSRAVDYLDKRKATGVVNHCTLPELFTLLREQQPELTITEYHAGLRRMHDRGVLRLLPIETKEALEEPEYALLDGAATFYHVAR